jgi:hypothetical protein
MNCKSLYKTDPFSIKEGYGVLWKILRLLTLSKHRVVTANHWKFPKKITCELHSIRRQGNFVSFTGNSPGGPVRVENGSYLRLFSSSLRYRVEIRCSEKLDIAIYSSRAELGHNLYPAIDVRGRPLQFTRKKTMDFEIQGLEFFRVVTGNISSNITIKITAITPSPLNDRTLGKRCLYDGCESMYMYTLTKDQYYKSFPSKYMKTMLNHYKDWFLTHQLQHSLAVDSFVATAGDLAITLVNTSDRPQSFLFTPVVVGSYATYDNNGIDTGISIPFGKTVQLSFPELNFVYNDKYVDSGDWEFCIETGSVHNLIPYENGAYSLTKTGNGYSLPVITFSGLSSFTFSIFGLGKTDYGILGLNIGPNWSIKFV